MSAEAGMARGVWAWWPLRLIVFFVVLVGLDIGCQIAPHFVEKYAPGLPKLEVELAGAALLAIVMIIAYRLLVRWTEKRAATELGWSKLVQLTVGGALLGFILFCLIFAVLFAFGVAKYLGPGTTEGLTAALANALAAAVGEEIVFRGGVYRHFEEGFGTAIALILSGALFGLIHSRNPGATVASSVAIALEAGVMLAAAYAWTRSLWLPIGLHFGWNFTEGGVFGAAVSGGEFKGLLKTQFVGPVELTGGQFGPEASIAAVALGLIAALVMLALAIRRGNWVPVRFRFRS